MIRNTHTNTMNYLSKNIPNLTLGLKEEKVGKNNWTRKEEKANNKGMRMINTHRTFMNYSKKLRTRNHVERKITKRSKAWGLNCKWQTNNTKKKRFIYLGRQARIENRGNWRLGMNEQTKQWGWRRKERIKNVSEGNWDSGRQVAWGLDIEDWGLRIEDWRVKH